MRSESQFESGSANAPSTIQSGSTYGLVLTGWTMRNVQISSPPARTSLALDGVMLIIRFSPACTCDWGRSYDFSGIGTTPSESSVPGPLLTSPLAVSMRLSSISRIWSTWMSYPHPGDDSQRTSTLPSSSRVQRGRKFKGFRCDRRTGSLRVPCDTLE